MSSPTHPNERKSSEWSYHPLMLIGYGGYWVINTFTRILNRDNLLVSQWREGAD